MSIHLNANRWMSKTKWIYVQILRNLRAMNMRFFFIKVTISCILLQMNTWTGYKHFIWIFSAGWTFTRLWNTQRYSHFLYFFCFRFEELEKMFKSFDFFLLLLHKSMWIISIKLMIEHENCTDLQVNFFQVEKNATQW